MPFPNFAVLLPAAGSSSRFGSGSGTADKLLVDLGGQSVLRRSVALFAVRPEVAHVTIVTAPERFDTYRREIEGLVPEKSLNFITGGRERWESVLFGLRQLAGLPTAPEFVAVHDAARPLCPQEVIDQAFEAAAKVGASLPCVPEPATLKRRSADGTVQETVDRRGLFQAQTPQCFRLKSLLASYELLLQQNRVADLTDDAQVFERTGHPVAITPGSPLNLKITTPEDLALARAILASNPA